MNQWIRHPYIAGYRPSVQGILSASKDVLFGFLSGFGSREVVSVFQAPLTIRF